MNGQEQFATLVTWIESLIRMGGVQLIRLPGRDCRTGIWVGYNGSAGLALETSLGVARLTTREEFVQNLIDSGLASPAAVQESIQKISAAERPASGKALAKCLVKQGLLTRYQAAAVLERDFDRLSIGQYEVLEQIGAGGMGTVYKARHRRMKRIVAIKMIVRRHEDSADIVRRFQREVEVIAALEHRNIVTAHDAGECGSSPFLVMEYVPGEDLETTVRRGGPLTVSEALDCILQSARGLAYAHEKNIIHRDVKPANLLRTAESGCIKITDLGLARIKADQTDSHLHNTSLTETGHIIGTVLFMAPEQSIDTRNTDHRSDIYSLGCTMFYLLHGRPPFMGESRTDTIMLHRQGPIPSLREGRAEIPESLNKVFRRMVAKSSDDRYPSMNEVVAALEACEGDATRAANLQQTEFVPHQEISASTMDFRIDEPTTLDMSVLLVEPSGAQALVIRGLLESLGISQIQRCKTGREALNTAAESAVNTVISAMHLDDMTGLQLAAQLRGDGQGSQVRFVLISSSLDAEKLKGQTNDERISVLAKPFNEKQLSDVLSKAAITGQGRT